MLARTLAAVERLVRKKVAAIEPEKVKQVLVLEYMLPLGNCVHLTPFFEALKECRPDVEITVVTRGMGLQVLRHSHYVDRLIGTPDPLTDLKGSSVVSAEQSSGVGARSGLCVDGSFGSTDEDCLAGTAGGAWMARWIHVATGVVSTGPQV